MAIVKLNFSKEKSVFGTTYILSSRGNSYSEVVVTNFGGKPFKNLSRTLTEGGYMFRNPKVEISDWKDMFQTLETIDGKFNLSVTYDKKEKIVAAMLRLAEQNDAAIFAWASNWQKWSEAEEAAYNAEKEEAPPKVTVDKDGKMKVTVTVTTLDDE